MLGEPAPSPGDLHLRVFNIPVRVHVSFWLVTAVLNVRNDLLHWLTWIAAVFVSILIHEMGHALAARGLGFLPWITLYGLGGLTSYNPELRYQGRRLGTAGEVFIAAAGPITGFLFAALLWLALRAAGVHFFYDRSDLLPMPIAILQSPPLARLVMDLFWVNLMWGAINLLPIYPLDGGQIAREIFLLFSARQGIRVSLGLSIVVAAALAAYGLLVWRSVISGLFFGYLAYSSYMALRAYRSYGFWR